MLKTRLLLRAAVQTAQNPDYLPSKSFMYVKVRRPGQKTHFVQVASEIELLKDVYGPETLNQLKINDDTWQILMEMGWEERYTYLVDLIKFHNKNLVEMEIPGKNEELVSKRNSVLQKSGEMVYARNFHSILELYGSDFRRQIDIFYGRNVMKQAENLKSFIVDCRFLRDFSVKTQAFYTNQMQSLHDENWLSNRPFSINFANYQADQQLVAIAKRNLLFQYGPPSTSTSSESFRPHPFAPVITSRRIDSVERKENLLYISPRATQFLPETIPPNIRGVVICLSNDSSPSTSSLSACIADKVTPYQLPFKRVVRSDQFRPNNVQLSQLARIFRQYFTGNSIDECILQNMDNLVRKRAENSQQKSGENDGKDEVFRSAMYHINNCSSSTNERRGKEHHPHFSSSSTPSISHSSSSSSSSSSSPNRQNHYQNRQKSNSSCNFRPKIRFSGEKRDF